MQKAERLFIKKEETEMEDNKILRNADEFIPVDELTPEELEEVAGGRTRVCVEYAKTNSNGVLQRHRIWKWEDQLQDYEKNSVVARKEYD